MSKFFIRDRVTGKVFYKWVSKQIHITTNQQPCSYLTDTPVMIELSDDASLDRHTLETAPGAMTWDDVIAEMRTVSYSNGKFFYGKRHSLQYPTFGILPDTWDIITFDHFGPSSTFRVVATANHLYQRVMAYDRHKMFFPNTVVAIVSNIELDPSLRETTGTNIITVITDDTPFAYSGELIPRFNELTDKAGVTINNDLISSNQNTLSALASKGDTAKIKLFAHSVFPTDSKIIIHDTDELLESYSYDVNNQSPTESNILLDLFNTVVDPDSTSQEISKIGRSYGLRFDHDDTRVELFGSEHSAYTITCYNETGKLWHYHVIHRNKVVMSYVYRNIIEIPREYKGLIDFETLSKIVYDDHKSSGTILAKNTSISKEPLLKIDMSLTPSGWLRVVDAFENTDYYFDDAKTLVLKTSWSEQEIEGMKLFLVDYLVNLGIDVIS